MKINTDIKYYRADGTVFVNGKRRTTEVIRPTTHTFAEAIKEINKSFNKYGILSKCDRIMGLLRRGYAKSDVRKALMETLATVRQSDIRTTTAKIYLERLERIRA